MFKHLLLPTDGSELSELAIQKCVIFAKAINARITGFTVVPEYHVFTYRTEMLSDTEVNFANYCEDHARQALATIERAAKEAGVEYAGTYATSDHPYEKIIEAANERGCDLIAMASHGRRGLQALLIGSEVLKVLTHSKIPVLVFR